MRKYTTILIMPLSWPHSPEITPLHPSWEITADMSYRFCFPKNSSAYSPSSNLLQSGQPH